MIGVAERLRSMRPSEPIRTHAEALLRRVVNALGATYQPADAVAWAAGMEYLAARVESADASVDFFAQRYAIPAWRLLTSLSALRESAGYRGYVGEWVRGEHVVQQDLLFATEELTHTVPSADPTLTRRASEAIKSKPSPRGWFSTITQTAGDLLRRFSSWTGTAGNKSYYNKDESPD